MHPVLWSRITDRRLSNKNTRLVNLTTYHNMSSEIADLEIIIKPSSDLAIQNYLLREILARDAVNWDFVNKHCVFATGPYDIGYGFRPKNADKFTWAAEKDIVANEQEHTLDRYEAIAQRRQAKTG
jgi:nitrate reductase NapA